ncbi:MAG: hypothetical protein ABEH43_03470 [Flavobacteriales bacterium]
MLFYTLKNIMRVLVFTFFILGCQHIDGNVQNPAIEVINATAHPWYGGIEGSKGVYYDLKILLNTNKEVSVDSLKIKNELFSLNNKKKPSKKTDTLFLRANRDLSSSRKEDNNKSNKKKRYDIDKMELKLIYRIRGERRSLLIEDIKEGESFNYP